MKLNSNRLTFLTFQESDRLKGLLILLIVFGHISQLLEQIGSLHATLYSFHVVAFLFLPFLFNKDRLTYQNIKKNLKRIYVPYTLFFLLSLFIYSILSHHFDALSALKSWFFGTSALLKVDIGLRVLWFFPALLFTLILIMSFNQLDKKKQKLFLILMLILHLTIPLIPKEYLFYFPLSSYIGFYLFTIGMIVKYIYEHYDYQKYPTWLHSLIFIGLLYLAYGSDFSLASAIFPNILSNPFYFILQDLIMISSFFTLILWSRKIKFFETFGKYSLAIFTIHPFVIQALNLIYPWETFTEGFIKFLLVLTITYILVRIIYLLKINKILYPH